MVWEVLAAEGMKAAAQAAQGPNTSGGGFYDARSMMDGSGWTVSTGRATATGGTSGSQGAMSGGAGQAPQAVDPWTGQLTFGGLGLMPVALVVLIAVMLAKRRKG